jgi:chromosome partitioning protein
MSATAAPHTIAVYNHKGGVGKTTASLNLAVSLAAAGKRCLLVDIDPQQSSTSILSRSGASPNLVDVLKKTAVIEDAVHETFIENLSIIPSTRSLTLLESGLDDRMRQNQTLRKFLNFSEQKFDIVVIDCPPAMGVLSISALSAADSVVIPTTSGAFSIQGVQRTVETVNALRGGLNPALTVNGILISVFEDTQRDRQTVRDLGQQFPGMLFRHRVRYDPEVLKAEVKRQPSSIFNRGAPSTVDYAHLTAEVLGRVHRMRRIIDQEFSFDDTAAAILESLNRPSFSGLKIEPPEPATAESGLRRGRDDNDEVEPPASGRASLIRTAAVFLADFLCGGGLAFWLGPSALSVLAAIP